MMMSLLPYFAPVALLLPSLQGEDSAATVAQQAKLDPRQAQLISQSDHTLAPTSFTVPVQEQIRIQRRVIIRIAPASKTQRTNLISQTQQAREQKRLVERKFGKCVPVSHIARVHAVSGNKLRLFLRDRRVLTMRLDKSCRSRDFYSGFYVERPKDGKLCVDRDELLSRSGAKCEFEKLRQLVVETR